MKYKIKIRFEKEYEVEAETLEEAQQRASEKLEEFDWNAYSIDDMTLIMEVKGVSE